MSRRLELALAAALAMAGCTAARNPAGTSAASDSDPIPRAEEPGDALRIRPVLSRVMREFGDAVEARSPRRVQEMLANDFDDLPRFEDALTVFLRETAEMRLLLRESSSEVKGNRATLIVDAEMVFSRPAAGGQREERRRERIQFDFVYTRRGWLIYAITPREFFTL